MNVRKCFFCVRVTEHRNRLPREAVEFPSLEIFKSHLDMVLAGSRWPCLNRGIGPGLLWRSLPKRASTKAGVIVSNCLSLDRRN